MIIWLSGHVGAQPEVKWWVSSEDMQRKLTAGPDLAFRPAGSSQRPTIVLDEAKTYQSIIGLGSSLEHSTCYNIGLLPPQRREQVLEKIVAPEKGIGMNLMRICIGTPDFTASPWYSYDDLPPDQTDPELKFFSIEKDRKYILPILKLALEKNPDLKFFATPWSPPAWMKTNKSLCGGRIDPQYFRPVAEYLARFVEAYRAEGIDVIAIMPQNEPEYSPDTYPTCGWKATEQRDFIRDHLGPVFQQRDLQTKIWCYDHNFNHPNYPITILEDPKAAQYIDGTAFHHYEGKPEAMSLVHSRFPDKHVYFSEGSVFGVSGAGEIVSFLRNWARCYNAWVTIIDRKGQPNRGPHHCSPTCIVLDSDTLELEYRFEYYMYGHFTKFIRRGAVRVDSVSSARSLPNVAFRNPDQSLALVVVNPTGRGQTFDVIWKERSVTATLESKSLATFVWKPRSSEPASEIRN